MIRAVSRALVAALLVACGHSASTENGAGVEGGPCYANGTCNAGLSCLSKLCVNGDSGAGGSTNAGGTWNAGGSSGAGGSMNAGGSTNTGAAAGTGGEDCTNGVDDDADQLADCNDPDCNTGYECVELPGVGWSGPVALWQGASGAAPPCASPFSAETFTKHTGVSATDAACDSSSCLCTKSQYMRCALPMDWYYAAGCVSLIQHYDLSSCQVRWSLRYSLDQPKLMNAVCDPSGTVTMATTAPAWVTDARACQPTATGAGCTVGSACVARPTSPFGSNLCIYSAGDVACPLPYSSKFVYYDDFADGRGCKACSCDASGISCSGGSLQFYTDATCAVPLGSPVSPPSSCGNTPSSTGTPGVNYINATMTGQCAPVPGEPTGSVTATTPTTVCCLP